MIFATAARTAGNWGTTTVSEVTAQLSAIWSVAVDPVFATRILSAARGFEWLDEPAGWFWFRTRPSRLGESLAKIFSVATSLSRRRLFDVLFKSHSRRLRPPLAAIDKIGSTLPGARLVGDSVTIPARLDRSVYLTPLERALVDALEPESRALKIQTLRGIEPLRSLTARAVLRLVRQSPLLEVLPAGRCCLVGPPVRERGSAPVRRAG